MAHCIICNSILIKEIEGYEQICAVCFKELYGVYDEETGEL